MTRTWAVVGVMAAAMVGSAATAQERVAAPPEAMVAHLRAEPAQVPLTVKMRVPLEAKVVNGAPYSADVITESIEVLADGNRIVRRTTGHVYRDGQGRVRRDEERDLGQPPSVTITDPVAHVSYALDPEAKVAWKTSSASFTAISDGATLMYTTSASDPADVEKKRILEQKITATVMQEKMGWEEAGQTVMLRDMPSKIAHGSPAWDEKVDTLPARQIEGVSAEGTRTTRTIPAGAIGNERPIVMVTEEWRSPDLQVLVLTTTSDPRTGDSTYKLVNISRGEPGAGYFEVPAGYTVNETNIRQNMLIKRDGK